MTKVLYRSNKKELYQNGYLIAIVSKDSIAFAFIATSRGIVVQIPENKFDDCLRIATPESPL